MQNVNFAGKRKSQGEFNINYNIMKKSLKSLQLKKEVISGLKLTKVKGGGSHCCPTQGALNSCPPPGMQCF